ncbi:MAG: hypothetical protein M1827_002133 [Pycnora praestabilis]|nr:MAG: hypothetical protein M1827_002133 [Pycnora praestabilis]
MEAEERAFLEWINSYDLSTQLISFKNLNDGSKLWELLHLIDPDYFVGVLQSQDHDISAKWPSKWQNLKQINKTVTEYIRDECKQTLVVDLSPDLKAIAIDSSPIEITKLLRIILVAAVSSSESVREYNVAKIMGLSKLTQEYIRIVVTEVIGEDACEVLGLYANSEQSQTISNDDSRAGSPKSPGEETCNGKPPMPRLPSMDRELLLEQRLAQTLKEKDELLRGTEGHSKIVRDLSDRVIHLQENNFALQQRCIEAEDRLELRSTVRDGFGAEGNKKIDELEIEIQHRSDVITTQETKIEELQAKLESRDKKIDSLRSSAGTIQKVRDELDETKVERDELAKKANGLEKYKQKVQASNDFEVECQHLRTELERIRLHSSNAAKAYEKIEGLERAVDQYKRMLGSSEQDHHTFTITKKRLEYENDKLTQKLEGILEQRTKDQGTIMELQDTVQELESGSAPAVQGMGDLGTELFSSEKEASDLLAASYLILWLRGLIGTSRLKITKLEETIQRLKDDAGSGTKANSAMLQQLLDDANERNDSLDSRYLDVYSEKLVLQSHVAALLDGTATEEYEKKKSGTRSLTYDQGSSMTYPGLLKRHTEISDRLDLTLQRLSETSADLSTAKRRLAAAESDLSLVDKDKIDILNTLKADTFPEMTDIRAENSYMHRRSKGLEADLDQHKALLTNAIREKSKLQTALSDLQSSLHKSEKSGLELKSTFDILRAATTARSEGREEAANRILEQQVLEFATKIENSRERLAKRTQHVKRQNEVIRDLQAHVKHLEESDTNSLSRDKEEKETTEKTATQQELTNLQRENALMATAWYDLTSRLQTNSVVLQRRNEPPKSWLNKQRQLLNSASSTRR